MNIGILYGKNEERTKDLKAGKASIGIDANSLYDDFNYYLQQSGGNLAEVAILIHRDVMVALGKPTEPVEVEDGHK